jgi:hypothetical protein
MTRRGGLANISHVSLRQRLRGDDAPRKSAGLPTAQRSDLRPRLSPPSWITVTIASNPTNPNTEKDAMVVCPFTTTSVGLVRDASSPVWKWAEDGILHILPVSLTRFRGAHQISSVCQTLYCFAKAMTTTLWKPAFRPYWPQPVLLILLYVWRVPLSR